MALFIVGELPSELPASAQVCHSLNECTEEDLYNPDIAIFLIWNGEKQADKELSLLADGFLETDNEIQICSDDAATAKEAVLSYSIPKMLPEDGITGYGSEKGMIPTGGFADFSYSSENRNFADMCLWWIKQKNISVREFYHCSNITRGSFYHITHTVNYMPKKTTALACAIGLGLNYKQAADLLSRAGLAFSPYYPLDVIVKGFILKGYYDIYRINEVLFDKNLQVLGSA